MTEIKDPASSTIDRHEPILPAYIQGELSLSNEHLYTKLKNRFVLRYCNVGQIKRWLKRPTPDNERLPPKVITAALMDKAEQVMLAKAGTLTLKQYQYLRERGVTTDEITRYKMCATQALCEELTADEITNLSLRISDKFRERVATQVIDGISIPVYYGDTFFGFCTRILEQPDIKYSMSIPQRFCFGIELTRADKLCVVEGVFDALERIRESGDNCMALGDSQPNYWKMMVANRFDFVELRFDNDYAGMLGAAKAHVVLEEMLGRSPERMAIIIDGDKITLRDLATELTKLGETHGA